MSAELLSVVIITYNEEKNIERCLDSVRDIADEIIVLDSFSTDNTVAIATAKGAKVYQQKFIGFIAQKNNALELATYDYVLSLDADEELDNELKKSIAKAKKGFAFKAYKMRRCANYCGKFIRYGTWYPDPKVRLFDKRILRWGGLDPHDKIVVPSNIAISPLKGEILHYSYYKIEEHVRRSDNFSTLAAKSLYKAGKKTNLLKIIASPAWSFINGYILHAGFLNGKYGWAIAIHQARYHFLKYSKLYKLQKNKSLAVENNKIASSTSAQQSI